MRDVSSCPPATRVPTHPLQHRLAARGISSVWDSAGRNGHLLLPPAVGPTAKWQSGLAEGEGRLAEGGGRRAAAGSHITEIARAATATFHGQWRMWVTAKR